MKMTVIRTRGETRNDRSSLSQLGPADTPWSIVRYMKLRSRKGPHPRDGAILKKNRQIF